MSARATAPSAQRRLFFALWPEASVRLELAAMTRLFSRTLSAQWTRPENLHITLAFLGEVETERLDAAKAAADAIHSEGFELALDRIEYWRKPQVLCLTPSTACETLERLAADLAARLQTAGFKLEERPYRAHLSLARKASHPPEDAKLGQAVVWQADSFALVESRQDGIGTRYTPIQSWPLSAC